MNDAASIYVLGDTNIDVLLPIDDYPEVGGDKRSERMVLESGGSAANTASALARFGHRAHLISCVGADVFGEMALERLGQAGVILDHVCRTDEDETGLMFVPVTATGQRTLFGRRGANRHLGPEDVPIRSFEAAASLHLSGYAFLEAPHLEAAKTALAAASKAGAMISLDTAYEPPRVDPQPIKESLRHVDLLILGEAEASSLSGASQLEESVAALQAEGVSRIALKRGARGSLLYEGRDRWQVPAFDVKTVDTTGAGDCYSGALLAGLLYGLDLPSAGILGNAAGALATTVWGAGPRAPSPDALQALLLSQPIGGGLSAAAARAGNLLFSLL